MSCKGCKYYIYSVTLGSSDIPIYHCRFGYSPKKGWLNTFVPPVLYDCQVEARECAKLSEPIQLSLF